MARVGASITAGAVQSRLDRLPATKNHVTRDHLWLPGSAWRRPRLAFPAVQPPCALIQGQRGPAERGGKEAAAVGSESPTAGPPIREPWTRGYPTSVGAYRACARLC